MTTTTQKGASLEVQEAFNRLHDRFRKYGSLDTDIIDPELRSKAGRLLRDEIYQGAVSLVQALAGAEAAANAAATPPKKLWAQKEIRDLRLSGKLTDELMAEIRQATAEGRVVE